MQHTKTIGVYYRKDFQDKDDYSLFSFDASKSGLGYVKVCDVDLSFETPDDFNLVAAQIDLLKAEQQEITRQFTQQVASIKERISKLECLEYSPAA